MSPKCKNLHADGAKCHDHDCAGLRLITLSISNLQPAAPKTCLEMSLCDRDMHLAAVAQVGSTNEVLFREERRSSVGRAPFPRTNNPLLTRLSTIQPTNQPTHGAENADSVKGGWEKKEPEFPSADSIIPKDCHDAGDYSNNVGDRELCSEGNICHCPGPLAQEGAGCCSLSTKVLIDCLPPPSLLATTDSRATEKPNDRARASWLT